MDCRNCGGGIPAGSRECPACGAVAGGGSKKGVLACVLVLAIGGVLMVPMIGICSAIAIPNLLSAIQRSKQKRTVSDMRSLSIALGAYQVDYDAYPARPSTIPSSSSPCWTRTTW